VKILILGGTQFVGRHIVEALLAAGHAPTLFTRGQTPDHLPTTIERFRGDRDRGRSGLGALANRRWDACIDVSGYTPRQVRASAECLLRAVDHYVYISAVMVYGDAQQRPVTEEHPRVDPGCEEEADVNGETYGPLKVACENIVEQIYASRCAVLRPQIVVGPHDPSGRFTYWLERARLGGQMLAPGDGSDHLQMIDARDLARFTTIVVEQRLSGPFNLAGRRLTWSQFMESLDACDLVWVPAAVLQSVGVTEFELPLYRRERGALSGLMDVSNERACRAGLTLTSLDTTVGDSRAWLKPCDVVRTLPAQREAELIALTRCGMPLSR
jgi:2'-hydroxyisoflavone reductase